MRVAPRDPKSAIPGVAAIGVEYIHKPEVSAMQSRIQKVCDVSACALV